MNVTGIGKNTATIGPELANTALFSASQLPAGTFDVTLTQEPSTFDGSQMTVSVSRGAAGTIFGYPQWVWGNAFVFNNLPVKPQPISSISNLWVHIDMSFTGNGQFNGLMESMLTTVPVSSTNTDPEPKTLEMAFMYHIPPVTQSFIFDTSLGFQFLGGFVDSFGRAWSCVFKPHNGGSSLGYCIWFPSDMQDRLRTEFDFAAMAKFAIAKITGATTALFCNGIELGMEAMGSSGVNVVKRNRWIRDFNNQPFLKSTPVKENIVPNSFFATAAGWLATAGVSFPGDGTMTVSGCAQFNNTRIPTPWQPGVTYTVAADLEAVTAGGFRFDLANNAGGSQASSASFTTAGHCTAKFTPTSASTQLRITMTGKTNTFKLRKITATPV